MAEADPILPAAQAVAPDSARTVHDAFISYRHNTRQMEIARALQRALQRFAKPWYRPRAVRLYRDETNLGVRPDLWAAIRAELDRSRFLLLMASPEAATSRWVEEETAHWLATKGQDTLLIVVTGGAVAWNAARQRFDPIGTTALPPAVLGAVTREPLWIDLTWVADPPHDLRMEHPKFHEAVASLAATLRGVDKDSLSGENLAQHRRAMRLAYGAVAAIGLLAIATFVAAAGFFFKQREAERQRDQVREALLQSAARESMLQVRDGRAEEAWDSLRNAVELVQPQLASRQLSARVSEAGLLALIENRAGPRLSLELSGASRAAAEIAEGELQPGSFSADGSRVAAGAFRQLGVWRVQDGRREQALDLPHLVEHVFFHDDGQVVFATGPLPKGDTGETADALTALDLASGRWSTHAIGTCRDALPCIAADGRPGRRLVDVRHAARPELLVAPGAQADRPDDLLVPARGYAGRAQGRFHVVLPGDVVFDEATQSSATINLPGPLAAVARDAPLILAGSGANGMLSLFRIESTRRGVAVRAWKTFGATQSSGTGDLALAPDGRTLFYSNYVWGTGRGNGTARTEAIDVQTGRSQWANGFEGTIVYSPDGTLIAQSDFEGTDVISAETSERLLRLPSYATAFSPDGRMLLSELREEKGRPLPGQAVWRLTETLPLPSLSRTEKLPPSLRGKCRADPSVFRIMADRTRRRWNAHDWRRIDAPGRAGIPRVAAVDSPSPRSRSFSWKGDRVRVHDYATNLREEALPAEVLARYPEARGKLRQGFSVLLTSRPSLDGRWEASLAAYEGGTGKRERWVSWTVAEAGGGRIVASGEMREKDPSSSGISAIESIDISFLAPVPAFAVQRDECTIDLFELPGGQKIGSAALAFSHEVWAQGVSDDVVALFSSDWYGSSRSVQLVSVPALAQGPWLLFDSGDPEEAPDPAAGPPRAEPGRGPLFALPCVGSLSFLDNGRYLVVDRDEECGEWPPGAEPVVLQVPPWGLRLDRLLLP